MPLVEHHDMNEYVGQNSDHKNRVLFCYAFGAISENQTFEFAQAVKNAVDEHLNDDHHGVFGAWDCRAKFPTVRLLFSNQNDDGVFNQIKTINNAYGILIGGILFFDGTIKPKMENIVKPILKDAFRNCETGALTFPIPCDIDSLKMETI